MQSTRDPQLDMPDLTLERIPDNLLLEPIEFIFADHCRQIEICQVLEEMVLRSYSSPIALHTAQQVLDCLQNDVSMHVADEEEDLFPRLRARVLPGDNFDDILRLLKAEHEHGQMLVDAVCADLSLISTDASLANPEEFRRHAVTLANMQMAHLKWENAVVLPLARLRLSTEDQRAMGRTMAARRNIAYPED